MAMEVIEKQAQNEMERDIGCVAELVRNVSELKQQLKCAVYHQRSFVYC